MTGAPSLLRWYRENGRDLPWRRHPQPWSVWVSEVMLQQTPAARVAPVFEAFLRRFPTVRSLAEASLGDVITEWGTLGYPRRARDLWRSARMVVSDWGGVIPSDPAALRSLPGVGAYTAAAITAFGFGDATAVPLDTNVVRVVRRWRFGPSPEEQPRPALVAEAAGALPGGPEVFHALMDVGATLCRARQTRCDLCPLASECRCAWVCPPPPGIVRRPQARYEGSRRQARGAVLGALRTSAEPLPLEGLDPSVVEELAGEGLVTVTAGAVTLPS